MDDDEIVRTCAEKVMRWRKRVRRRRDRQVSLRENDFLWDRRWDGDDMFLVFRPSGVFNPLISDADAFAVLDKMQLGLMPWPAGRWIAFRPDMEGAWRGLSDAPGDRMYDGSLGGSVVDNDRRRAIVLAALKAVGVKCS